MRNITVKADWDPEAEVWVATSDDVAGLATEAGTLDELVPKLKLMVPELLALNKSGEESEDCAEVPISLLSKCNFTGGATA